MIWSAAMRLRRPPQVGSPGMPANRIRQTRPEDPAHPPQVTPSYRIIDPLNKTALAGGRELYRNCVWPYTAGSEREQLAS
ncbi:MAG: hypothetical protein AMXMBFR13_39670 [Phycisphaerae bacterium]